MQKSNINPACLQPMLESAANASEKGQSQFFTPLAFGRRLAEGLPRLRPNITDLNCGAGHLLQASANKSTALLLGSDIDPARPKIEGLAAPVPVSRLTCDATKLYPMQVEIELHHDLFVLNPPWRLWFYRDRLRDLADAQLAAVREAFAQLEEAAPRRGTVDGTIDSTIAMLLIALDRCSYLGEGLLIANNATLERLIFAPNAPHAAVARHIWAHVIIPGNPMTGIDDCLWEKDQQFHTGVIYFAPGHESGPERLVADPAKRTADPNDFSWVPVPDRSLRMGPEISYPTQARKNLDDDWHAIKDQIGLQAGSRFNLWLTPSGRITCNLSLFEEKSTKVDKREAQRLFELRGHTPMELVVQRAQRDELLHTVRHPLWKVSPDLIAAVNQAVTDYNAQRAPLYPLPPIQRLGYLDEQDVIECKRDLMGLPIVTVKDDGKAVAPKARVPKVIFRKGEKYSIRTQTVNVTRTTMKPNPFTGMSEECEHSGQELAIYLCDGLVPPGEKIKDQKEYCFMDASIMSDPETKVKTGASFAMNGDMSTAIHFSLQQLADHFVIPDVPDVATVHPEQYRKNLDTLVELESITTALTA